MPHPEAPAEVLKAALEQLITQTTPQLGGKGRTGHRPVL
jgi:hypothetical protein